MDARGHGSEQPRCNVFFFVWVAVSLELHQVRAVPTTLPLFSAATSPSSAGLISMAPPLDCHPGVENPRVLILGAPLGMVSVPLLLFVFFRAFVLQARVTGKSTVPEDTVLLRVEDFTRAARRGGGA